MGPPRIIISLNSKYYKLSIKVRAILNVQRATADGDRDYGTGKELTGKVYC
jgi:hypothetical protein